MMLEGFFFMSMVGFDVANGGGGVLSFTCTPGYKKSLVRSSGQGLFLFNQLLLLQEHHLH